jgi:hypothetical protein
MVLELESIQERLLQERYEEIRSALIPKYPNLGNEDWQRWYPPREDTTVRTAYFRYGESQILEHGICKDANQVHELFNARLDSAVSQPSRTLLIMESFNAAMRNVLVAELGMDPQVLFRHARIGCIWEDIRRDAGDTPSLASLSAASHSFSVDFTHLVHLNLEDQQFTLRCLESERHISSSRSSSDGRLDGIGAVSCRLTFWGRRLSNDGWIGE